MSGFHLTQEQQQLRQLAAELARDVYAPKAAQWDADRTPLPEDEVKRLADMGFLGIAIPEEYGGQGGTLMDALIVIEELAKECRPAAFQVFEANTGPDPGAGVLRERGAEADATFPARPGRDQHGGRHLRAGRRIGRDRHAHAGPARGLPSG